MRVRRPWRAKGSEEVDGRQLDRYEVESDGVAQVLAVDRIELLVDSSQRLAGVRLEGSRSIDYDLSDYGVDVSVHRPARRPDPDRRHRR